MEINKSVAAILVCLLLTTLTFAQSKMAYQKAKTLQFYEPAVYQSLVKRLDSLQPNAVRQWGKMDAAQMLHHLNLAIGSGLGYYELPNNSSFMSRTVNKWLILSALKRFPMGTKTAPSLKVESNFDFETEKKQLKEILDKAYRTKTDADWQRHTYFGKLTRAEWGKLMVIHCNHHFQQFSN
jgi:hypothetical protein